MMRCIAACLILAFFWHSAAHGAGHVRLSPDTVIALAVSQSAAVQASALTLEARKRDVQAAAAGILPSISSSVNYTHLSKQPVFAGFGGRGGGALLDVAQIIDTGRVLDAGDYLALGMLDRMFSALSEPMAMAPQNITSIGLTVTQPIFTGGKLINAVRMAQHAHNAQVFAHERTIAEMELAALRLFWVYVSLIKQREALREGEAWLQNMVNDVRTLYETGMAIELDLLNTQLQLDNYKLGGMKLDNASRTMGEQLLLFLGMDPQCDIILDTSRLNARPGIYVPPLPDSLENWLVYRNDLRVIDNQLEAVKDLRRLHLSSYAPNLTGFASYTLTNQYTMEDWELEPNPSVGLALNWTLFDWGKAWRMAQSVQCQIRQMELMRNDLRMRIRLKYIELSRKVEETRATVQIALDDLEHARKALEIARLKYEAGSITNTELLNARSQLTQKMVAYAIARINAIIALEEYRIAPVDQSSSAANSGGAAAGSPSSWTGGN